MGAYKSAPSRRQAMHKLRCFFYTTFFQPLIFLCISKNNFGSSQKWSIGETYSIDVSNIVTKVDKHETMKYKTC